MKSPPEFCGYQPEAFTKGRNHTEGPLFDRKEQMGVWVNMILATGGLLSGLKWHGRLLYVICSDLDKRMINERKPFVRLGVMEVNSKRTSEGRGFYWIPRQFDL